MRDGSERHHEDVFILVASAFHRHCLAIDFISLAICLKAQLIFAVFDNRFLCTGVIGYFIADSVYQGANADIGYAVLYGHRLGGGIYLAIMLHKCAVHMKNKLASSA
ncbi:hypothetical protein D3C77_375090 [compost metagenome]